MLARAVSTAFATPAAAPNTASPPGSARSRPGSARHVVSPTRSDRPLPGPHAQVDGRSAAHMPSQPRSAALRGCVQNKSKGGISVDFSRRELLYERINRKDARSELKMFAIGYP